MDPADLPEEGTVISYERTFTREDVEAFADLSGDRGAHHEEPDEDGRLVVHGLLTATLPTKIGGDLDMLARESTFRFHRPVYTGQRITCETTLEEVVHGDGRADVDVGLSCHNEAGDLVLSGSVDGVVFA